MGGKDEEKVKLENKLKMQRKFRKKKREDG